MAIRLADVYTQSLPASSDYPGGGFKNATSAGGNDGTPLDQAWANDFLGFFQAVLLQAGVTASGSPDNARASQYLEALKKIGMQSAYPVGSVYINAVDDTNPATLMGFGTWAQFAVGQMLEGCVAGQAGQTGGEVSHTLTAGEMPSHTHSYNDIYYAEFGGTIALPANIGSRSTDNDNGGYQMARTTDATGSGAAHNNMPPFITVYMWRRVS